MQPRERQQLWMMWPEARLRGSVDPKIPDGYFIRTYQTDDDQAFFALMALMDFDPWTPEKLDYNISRILPGGWFFAVATESSRLVATAMCLHNYSGQSPFTGDLGWLACHPAHRGKGLGYSLSACVTNRFRNAGYSRIQLHTEYYRLPAIKTYLKLGFVPVMYGQEIYTLWGEVCQKLNWPYTPQEWPNNVTGGTTSKDERLF
jgi:mycothiol synthase